jgi:O-antigen/teichoic acid export membrane protein
MASPSGLGRIGRHTAVYAIGVLLNRATAFIMLPVYTRYLTPADYGTLQLLMMVVELVSIVAGSRLGAGIFYYFQKADNDADKRAVLSTAAVVMAVSYGTISLATYLAAPHIAAIVFRSAADTRLVRLAVGGLASQSLLLVPFAYLQVQERSASYVGVTSAKLVMQLGLNILFVVGMGLGAAGALWSNLIANVVVGTCLTMYLFARIGVRVSGRTMRALLRFGLPYVPTQVATFVLTFGDRYFLNKAGGAAVVGLYGLAYQFGFVLFALAYTPFSSIWDPARFTIARRTDRDLIYARVFVYLNVRGYRPIRPRLSQPRRRACFPVGGGARPDHPGRVRAAGVVRVPESRHPDAGAHRIHYARELDSRDCGTDRLRDSHPPVARSRGRACHGGRVRGTCVADLLVFPAPLAD